MGFAFMDFPVTNPYSSHSNGWSPVYLWRLRLKVDDGGGLAFRSNLATEPHATFAITSNRRQHPFSTSTETRRLILDVVGESDMVAVIIITHATTN